MSRAHKQRAAASTPSDQMIYAGQTWLGSISPRVGRWRAIAASGRIIATFGSAVEARRAVLDAAPDNGGST